MTHYKSNLRDMFFNLFEVNRVQDHLGTGPYEQMDADSAKDVLREVDRLAREDFAASFVAGDRTPLQLDAENGEVTLPKEINETLDAFFDNDWHLLYVPPHLGGYGASPSITWSASELLLGANASAMLYTAGPFFATILDSVCNDEQRTRFVEPMIEHKWGATMVLTEPEAGSDVGAGRAKAVDNGDGTWTITGNKRFITSGDFDWPDNVIHLVLARPEGAGPGTKGLSLYVVPKYWVNEDGSLGERNGVWVRAIEDKMGIKASATAELYFSDTDVPARGILVGEVHDGIAQMFRVIEYARMLVGTKAISTLSTGYLNALEYAKERVQGPDLKKAMDKTAPRVEIMRHPDVRRNLMMQKAHVEGMRALVMYTGWVQDQIAMARHNGDDEAAEGWEQMNDLLLPMVKGYGSEKSYELLAVALQVFGGSGFTRDVPLEQYIRDAKIDTLYEGTTGIQGMDLFFRKIGKDQGATLTRLLTEVQNFAKDGKPDDGLQAERQRLATALEDVQGMLGSLVQFLGEDLYKVGLSTTPFLMSLSEVVVGWLSLRGADVALTQLNSEDVSDADRDFYTGKVAAARWFAHNVLPQLSSRREIMAATSMEVMEVADAAF
ncbi:Acyl-CoA dehydrogenase [Euzebya pacifica]|uniref:Acyl-CoA dehydrogenase n=1 Tax=Euzebya pacifica TaxID=1608957 RepID=A0A346Y041_9ACTN|nr:acyl-CoA dehydrogenase [Euzebya pacifica]AXV07838.1 Acyl-CoA dehydrogenase [Euzebya pacifica]